VNEQNISATPVFRGTEREVRRQLRGLLGTGTETSAVDIAVRQVREGYRHITCAGERFEVVDQEWSIVQNVYGCEDGRGCRNVSKRQRRCFEATIRARIQAEE